MDKLAGQLVHARSPIRVKIWSGEWKTGLDKWNFAYIILVSQPDKHTQCANDFIHHR